MPNTPTLLIDGNNALHRAHWVAKNTKTPLINSQGKETGTLFTFLKTLKTSATIFNTNKIYIAWDTKLTGKVNFRKTLTEGTYKGTRDTARNKDVYEYSHGAVLCTAALGIKNIYPGSLEADDVISWLAKKITGEKIIVSVDNDFAQLVSAETSLYNPIKKITYKIDNFNDYFGISPRGYTFYKAIVGDTSDNIEGLEGFGKIKGLKLAQSFLENNEAVITPFKEKVFNNLKLVDLSYGIDNNSEEIALYEEQFINLQNLAPDFTVFENICNELEFNSISRELDKWKNTFGKTTSQSLVDFCKLFG